LFCCFYWKKEELEIYGWKYNWWKSSWSNKDNKDLNLDDAYKQLYKDYFLEKYENE